MVTDDPLVLLEESLLDVSVRCCSSNMYGWSWVYIRPPMESTISKRTARTLSAVPRKYSLRTAGTMITGLRQKPVKQEEERWSGQRLIRVFVMMATVFVKVLNIYT